MTIKIINSINNIKEKMWNKLVHEDDPFNQYHFLKALEDSGSVSSQKGFSPSYLLVFDGEELTAAMVNYVKEHSYGEYIFDWAWADFYQRHQREYYPKIVSQNPFSPVTHRTFLYKDTSSLKRLLNKYNEIATKEENSAHLLFLEKEELTLVPDQFKLRKSFQYHWSNKNYTTFEHFLSEMKTKKRKQILKERKTDLLIREISEEDLESYTSVFYEMYVKTIMKKHSYAYLNEFFFKYIFKNLKEHIVLIGAFNSDNQMVAASLYLKGKNKLYGRYWGALEEHNNLHFELCYYQGIEYCIRNNITTFEAGAQGEHKIQRGFRPVLTHSAHYINDPLFRAPIYNFIDEEADQIKELLPQLSKKLPFKNIL
jgi:predicted N-acyltransferase